MVDTSAMPSLNLSTAASSKGASPTRSSVAAERLAPRSRTRDDSGEPPHFAAQPPQDVHSVSLSSSTPRVSQAREDGGRAAIAPGTPVEVRTGFDRSWAGGFEVVSASQQGYVLRRLSDGRELPHTFAIDDVRRERRDSNMWWV